MKLSDEGRKRARDLGGNGAVDRGKVEMEQVWTVDKHDVPRGDLEFWATRRGILGESAKPDVGPVNDGWRGTNTLKWITFIAALLFASGLAVQASVWPIG
jgi:hypothetical protein